jgi:hypothetical protein
MFYPWSCDLVGKLPQTSRGDVYITIMIEHFLKWVKLVVLLDKSSHNTNKVFLQFVLSALLIKDQNSETNFKTYLIMLSLTIVGLQGIIPKLMALKKGWFRHVRRDFGRFVSLRTNRIETYPYLTSPWVTRCPNMSLCLIFALYFLVFGRHPIPPSSIAAQMDQVMDLDSLANWVTVIVERAALFKRVMAMAMENLSIA